MRQKLIKFLNSEGLSVSPVVFDEAGITSWKFKVSSLWRSELMQIENFKIRSGRSLIIAEIGNNHNGNIDIAKSMIDAAIESGADCVKFQMRQMKSAMIEV